MSSPVLALPLKAEASEVYLGSLGLSCMEPSYGPHTCVWWHRVTWGLLPHGTEIDESNGGHYTGKER